MNLHRLLYRKRRLIKHLLKSFGLILLSVFICEFFVFLIYIGRCRWPSEDLNNYNLRTIALSDPHILGSKRGFFFDKLKREWAMHISFRIAISFFNPNSVFFLGDIFDEGLIASENEFNKYSERFFELFQTDTDNLIVSTGNHDVGFHDRMVYFDPLLRGRFEKVFNSSIVDHRIINGFNVINVNSMAMNDDNCELCSYAKYLVNQISDKLFKKCKQSLNKSPATSNEQNLIDKKIKLCNEQRPILLTHFPLFRKSDLDCNEPDSNYDQNDKINIKPNSGCLSKESTNFLLEKLQPKLALNGHTHYSCIKKHTIKLKLSNYLYIKEYTLSSFNWRNRPNPGFVLLLANSDEIKISKCMLPNELYLFIIYFLPLFYLIFNLFR